jgi:hypothetical protein
VVPFLRDQLGSHAGALDAQIAIASLSISNDDQNHVATIV